MISEETDISNRTSGSEIKKKFLCTIFSYSMNVPEDHTIAGLGCLINTSINGKSLFVQKIYRDEPTININFDRTKNFHSDSLPDGRIWTKRIFSNMSIIDISYLNMQQEPACEYSLSELRLVGHRGCGEEKHQPEFAENTVPSFAEAHRRGAQMVELDVHITRDGHVVVNHDDFIEGRSIPDMTFSEFSDAMESIDKTPVKLSDVLRELDQNIGINIELKSSFSQGFEQGHADYLANLVMAVAELTKTQGQRKILFSSFDPIACLYIKGINESHKTCLILSESRIIFLAGNNMSLYLKDFVKASGLDGLVLDSNLYEKEQEFFKELMEKDNVPILCYGDGTNDLVRATRLYNDGISGLITDRLSLFTSDN